MAYTNYTPGAGGGSTLTVSPGSNGGGEIPDRGPYGGGGGGNAAFMEMLAMSRMDRNRGRREQEAMARREMLMREGQSRQDVASELGRRSFAERELESREAGRGQQLAFSREQLRSGERGEAQRLALEGSRTRSALRGERLQQKGEEARQRAASSRVPMREVSGPGAQYMTGKLARPNELTALERQAHGFSGYNIPPSGG